LVLAEAVLAHANDIKTSHTGRRFARSSDMRILISNDDGIYSPGIATLAEVASEFGSVRVVAPDVERSSMGHAITASRPLSYRATRLGNLTAYRVNGTPADCVALGTHHWEKVDLVLSGLNHGLNLGNSIWHSGTLAAAKQAALLGLRGIALSAPAAVEPDFDPFKPWLRRVLQTLMAEDELPLVNVNLPREPRGMVWTRASVRRYDGRIVPTTDPLGRELFWFTVTPIEGAEEGTDRWAVEQGWISLTPLRLDLTDDRLLEDVRLRHPLDEGVAAAVSSPTSSPEAAQSVREDEAATAIAQSHAEPADAGRTRPDRQSSSR
jgi:5'-nucleotidase